MEPGEIVPFESLGDLEDFDYPEEFPPSDRAALKSLADEIHKSHSRGQEIGILYGGFNGIFVHSTDLALDLYLPTIEWMSQTPVPSLVAWRTTSWDEVEKTGLEELLLSALKARRKQFLKCRFCGEEVPPEHRIKNDVCHGCAERHLGVVF